MIKNILYAKSAFCFLVSLLLFTAVPQQSNASSVYQPINPSPSSGYIRDKVGKYYFWGEELPSKYFYDYALYYSKKSKGKGTCLIPIGEWNWYDTSLLTNGTYIFYNNSTAQGSKHTIYRMKIKDKKKTVYKVLSTKPNCRITLCSIYNNTLYYTIATNNRKSSNLYSLSLKKKNQKPKLCLKNFFEEKRTGNRYIYAKGTNRKTAFQIFDCKRKKITTKIKTPSKLRYPEQYPLIYKNKLYYCLQSKGNRKFYIYKSSLSGTGKQTRILSGKGQIDIDKITHSEIYFTTSHGTYYDTEYHIYNMKNDTEYIVDSDVYYDEVKIIF